MRAFVEGLLKSGQSGLLLENKEFFNVRYFAEKLGKVPSTLSRGNLTLHESRVVSMFFAKRIAAFVKACDQKRTPQEGKDPFALI